MDEQPTATGPLRVLGRVPFTTAVLATMVVAGFLTRALWAPLHDSPLWDDLAYGLPAFEAGQWWTVVTGSALAASPWQYLPVIGGFALLVGYTEWRMGSSRAAVVTVAGQALGVVLSAVMLSALSRTGWAWAVETARLRDVGFSAGAIAALTASAAALRPPWRARVWLVTAVYVLTSAALLGTLADLEHIVGLLVGLALGPWLTGRPAALRLRRTTRREMRLLASGFFVASAAVVLLTAATAPTDGPLGPFGGASWAGAGFSATIDLVIAAGLHRGRRVWWRIAIALTSLSAALALLLVLAGVGPGGETGLPREVLTLLLDLGALALLGWGRAAFRNVGRGDPLLGGRTGSDVDRARARELLVRLGCPNRISWMTTWPESSRWQVPDVPGYVAYQVHARGALALGDPVAATVQERRHLIETFMDAATEAGLTPGFFSATTEVAALAGERGWLAVQVAEEAVIDLPALSLRGKQWQSVRTALNQASKVGIEHRLVRLADEPVGVQAQVRAISDAWVVEGGLPEMGFTLGGVDEALDRDVRVGLAVDANGHVHGVTSWLPIHRDGRCVGWTLDLMRRAEDSFRPTMEFLIASACLEFQEEGYAEASLSGAPLAGEHADDVPPTAVDLVLERMSVLLEPLYGFRSLHQFKQKFRPRPDPLYLVVRDEAALPAVGLALGRAYLPDATPGDLVGAVRQVRSGSAG
ncbi:bifunctional lysylphosphatidylglycerol flippase/synthetase MprF [Cellulomonas soli]|uniref:Phosphatidylglycerol lysyltransferase C-terminal domain-containing protein n=1 Tax=Cellulomonas soli TaxID=931535 RepID=A0A512PCA9_9CELL|nr:DUF2156 domain-containing protein [Cellulomonas soli]NYI58406.1 hypothetical protein [Cellulomonas soli]GEP68828.1 hypothetical protein CSO01_15430 [Cellulomonas soli]